MAIRVSRGGEWRISDPIAFVIPSTDAFGAFYLEIRQALHTAIREVDSVTFLRGHSAVINRVREQAAIQVSFDRFSTSVLNAPAKEEWAFTRVPQCPVKEYRREGDLSRSIHYTTRGGPTRMRP